MCVESIYFTSTALTYIALNALEILQLVLTVSTYITFKNQLNIKKVMDRNVCTVCRATNTSVFVLTNNIAYTIQCIACFDLCVDSVDKQHSIHNT